MSGFWYPPDDHSMENQVMSGSAHSVSSDTPPEDVAEKVRRIAEEVSRKTMPKTLRKASTYSIG